MSKDDKDWKRKAIFQYQKDVVRYAYSIVKDKNLAQELAQESFLRMIDKADETEREHIKEWLFRVCRNLAIDDLRKKGTHREKALNIEVYFYNTSESLEKDLEEKEMTEVLKDILEKLSPEQQEILRLKFHEGLSYKQISEITGYTVNHVGVLIHNTLKRTRELLEKKTGEN